jgi:hypothetical protein
VLRGFVSSYPRWSRDLASTIRLITQWHLQGNDSSDLLAPKFDFACRPRPESLDLGLHKGHSRASIQLARRSFVRMGRALIASRVRIKAPIPPTPRSTPLRIAGLTVPLAGTPRSELLEEERIGLAVLRLLAAYALRLCASDSDRHSVLAIDEAWALLTDSQGRALLERISRLGRSQNLTPILATQMLGDASEIEPLVGAFFTFGVETEDEARRALSLLRLDSDGEAARRRLIRPPGGALSQA